MRRRLTLAALILMIALAAAGTVLWITGILRPAPSVAPGVIRSALREGGTLALIVDAPDAAPIDGAGETVRAVARAVAGGRVSARLLVFDVRTHAGPLMRLVYDPGILAAGAVSGGTGDHMLGLAGAGSRWPQRAEPAVERYCARMKTATQPFCERVTRG